MTQYRTYIDSNTAFGQQTIQSVTNNGSQYGIGIGTNIMAGVVTATTYYGDGSQLSGIIATGSGVAVKDDGILVGVTSTIDFGSNLSVSPISGGVITVTATGIGTTGSINTSGIITASAYYGVGLPQNLRTSSYALSSSDSGKHVAISTGGVTLNSSIFDTGDVVTIYNDSSYTQMITVGAGVTMRRVSIGDTGNRGLNSYGLATILCIGTNSYIISGAGVT